MLCCPQLNGSASITLTDQHQHHNHDHDEHEEEDVGEDECESDLAERKCIHHRVEMWEGWNSDSAIEILEQSPAGMSKIFSEEEN